MLRYADHCSRGPFKNGAVNDAVEVPDTDFRNQRAAIAFYDDYVDAALVLPRIF